MESISKENPKFNGSNYQIWKDQMTTCMICMGDEYRDIIEKPYITPNDLSQATVDENKKFKENMLATEALINALSDTEYSHIYELRTTHEVWTKSETIYEGDKYVK